MKEQKEILNKMFSKERVLRNFRFFEVDCVSTIGGWIMHPEFLAEAAGMKIDDYWANPKRCAIQAYKNLGCDIITGNMEDGLNYPKPGWDATGRTGTNCSEDYKSSLNRVSKQFPTPESVIEDVKKLPTLKELHKTFCEKRFQETYEWYVDRCKVHQSEVGEEIFWLPFWAGEPVFHGFFDRYGYENFLMTLALYPDEMKKFYKYLGEEAYLQNQAIVKAMEDHNLPMYLFHGQDICDNRGPLCSPEILRKVYFPALKRAFEPYRKASVKVVWHSDGNVNPIIEDLLDCGIAGFQGFQEEDFLPPECQVNLERLAKMKSRGGDKLILFGSISVRTTLPKGSVEDVKKEVERCIDVAAKGGGYFLFCANTVGPDVPKENIYAMYRHAKVYSQK